MSSGWEIQIRCEIELSGDILVVVRLNSLLPQTWIVRRMEDGGKTFATMCFEGEGAEIPVAIDTA
jgi:hypothetical protein